MSNRKYGWKKELVKYPSDSKYNAYEGVDLPKAVDLSPKCPPVYDQGDLGSCTANAIAAAVEFDQLKQGLPDFTPSRLFIYYNERVMEGDPDQDGGAEIRDGIKSINTDGVCAESLWPYDISKFTDKPNVECYTTGKQNKSLLYQSVNQDHYAIKHALVNGLPVVFGFTVYESFESDVVATTGIMPMPVAGEQVLGGHAVIAVGYDDSKQAYLVRNSWGTSWGLKGYFYMPYAYMVRADYVSDLWCVQTIA